MQPAIKPLHALDALREVLVDGNVERRSERSIALLQPDSVIADSIGDNGVKASVHHFSGAAQRSGIKREATVEARRSGTNDDGSGV